MIAILVPGKLQIEKVSLIENSIHKRKIILEISSISFLIGSHNKGNKFLKLYLLIISYFEFYWIFILKYLSN